MTTIRKIIGLCLVALLVASCMTTQSRYSMLDKSYSPKPKNYDIQIFHRKMPQRPFIRISRLDVHLKKSHFIGSSLDEALPELKKQARLSGADAVIEIRERSSMIIETKVCHVTATGVRFTN